MKALTYADHKPMLRLLPVLDRPTAEAKLKKRVAAALVIFQQGFSEALQREGARPSVTVAGDLTNPYYTVAAVLAGSAVGGYVEQVTGRTSALEWREETLGTSAARSEFDLYVPGLLILAVTMLIYSTAMMAAREAEWGTLQRLQLSRMTAFDFLAGISLVQLIVAALLVGITLVVALALGFHSAGALWLVFVLGTITALSVIGIGLIVAALSRSELEAFLYGNFPLFLLMFFTGALFPIPKLVLVTIGGIGLGPADLLPPTHAVVALNKVLTHGDGLASVTGELTALMLLTALYFIVGVWLFQRRQLKTA
jgi:ABC-2 type transport system permease protein